MRRALVLLGATLFGAACIGFDKKLSDCDAGLGVCARDGSTGDAGDAGTPDGGDAGTDGGAASWDAGYAFCTNGWCWIHPRPFGDDLNAITGTSESDVWVVGPGGLVAHFDGGTWEDRSVAGVTGGEYGSTGNLMTIALTQGTAVVSGDRVLPRRWDAASRSWVQDGYSHVGSAADTRKIYKLRTAGGQLIAVGVRYPQADQVLVAVLTDAGWIERDVGLSGTGTALDGTDEPMFVAGSAGVSAALYRLDGGLVSPIPVGASFRSIGAMWTEPDAGRWLAGAPDILTLFDAGFSGQTTVSAAWEAGLWLPGVKRNIVTGNDVILEGRAGAFTRLQIADQLPRPTATLHDLWFDETERTGLIVGNAATILQRDSDTWRYHDGGWGLRRLVFNELDVLIATPDLVFGGGDDATKFWITDDLVPITRVLTASVSVVGAWIDDAGILTGEKLGSTGGHVCTVTALGCQRPIPTFGNVEAMWASSRQDVVMVGAGGGIYRLDGGAFMKVTSAPMADYTGITGAQGHLFMSSSGGLLYELTDAGAVEVFDAGHQLAHMTSLPSGHAFAVGRETALVRYVPGTGWSVTDFHGFACRNEILTDVFAFDPDDIWAVGTNGGVLHVTSAGAEMVEIGTRLDLKSVTGRQSGNLREVWIGGQLGAVLYTRYVP